MGDDFKLSGKLEITGIEGLDRRVQEMQHKLGNLGIGNIAKNYADVEKATKKAEQGTKALNREILTTATSAQDFADKAGLALRRFAAFTVAAGATYGAARLVVGGLRGAAQFERELVKVKQVTDASSKSIEDLQRQISALGSSLGAPAEKLVGVAKTLSQAGLSISQVKTVLEGLAQTRLASSFGDMESTAQGVIAIMGQFKATAQEATDALALTNATAAKFAVESDGLITAVRQAGGAFSQASEGIDDTNTSLAKFYALVTSVTQTTRQSPATIATGLRTVIARLQRPSTNEYLKDNLGVNIRDAEGNFVGVDNAIKRIQEGLKDVDVKSEKFAKTIEVIGGNRQYGIVVPLLREAALQNEILNKSLADQKNFLREVNLPLQTLSSQFERLAATWASFSRDVYNSPVFQFLAHQALGLAESLVKVADSIAPIIPLITILSAAKLGETFYKEGVFNVLKTRLGTGKGASGINHKAAGGYVPGYGSGDVTPLMAEPGEYVIRKKAAMALGGSVLNRLNNADRYATGGNVKVKRSPFGIEQLEVGFGDEGSQRTIKALRNPSYSQVEAFAKNTKGQRVRGTPIIGSNDYYVWNANEAIHAEVQEALTGRFFESADAGQFDLFHHPEHLETMNDFISRWQKNKEPFLSSRDAVEKRRKSKGYAIGGQVSLAAKTAKIESGLKERYNIYSSRNTEFSNDIDPKIYHNNIARVANELVRMSTSFSNLGQYERSNPKLNLIMKKGNVLTKDIFGSSVNAAGIFNTAHLPEDDPGSRKFITMASDYRTDPSKLLLGQQSTLVSTSNFNDVFRHEYGHYLDNSRIQDTFEGDHFQHIAQKYLDEYFPNSKTLRNFPGEGYPVSRYAATNPKELFAESFSAFTHPDYGKSSGLTSPSNFLPKDLHNFMQKHFGRKASGGGIGGSGSGDTVPIMAEPGEFIIRKKAAQKLGIAALNKLNHAEKFADGGFVGQGENIIRNDGGFAEIRTLFIKFAKELGADFGSITKILKEVEGNISSLPTSLSQAREGLKQLGGALQATRIGPKVSGPTHGFKGDPNNPPLGQSLNITPAIVQASKDAANKRDLQRLPVLGKGESLDSIKFPHTEFPLPDAPFPMSMQARREQALRKVEQARFMDTLGSKEFDNRRAYKFLTDETSGKGQRTLFDRGNLSIPNKGPLSVGANELGTTTYGTLSTTGFRKGFGKADPLDKNFINYRNESEKFYTQEGLISPDGSGPSGPGLFPPKPPRGVSLSRKFNRFKGRLRQIGNSRALDPFALGIASTLTQQYLPESKATSALSGGLAGASAGAYAGSLIAPGIGTAIGAGIGGVVGGVSGFVQQGSREEDARNAKALATATKELTKSFNDLSEKGIKNFDENLSKALSLNIASTNKQYKPGVVDRLGNAIHGYSNYELSGGMNAPNDTTNKPGIFTRLNRFNTSLWGEAPSLEDKVKTLSEKNNEIAKVSRSRIHTLLKQGRFSEISQSTLDAASSDDSTANLTGKSGRVIHSLATVIPAEIKKIDSEAKIASAIKTIDLFQNKLARSIDSLGAFNNKLDASANVS